MYRKPHEDWISYSEKQSTACLIKTNNNNNNNNNNNDTNNNNNYTCKDSPN